MCGRCFVGSRIGGDTGQELIGTWKSPQAVDTYLRISNSPAGLVVTEVHQNVFGGGQTENRPATFDAAKGMLKVGTTVFHFDQGSQLLVVHYLGHDAVFARDPS